MPKSQADGPSGLIVVDKPAGWTSHDVVGRMRRLLGTRKVGHGGTLDPMATGVLVIACGKATRLLQYISAHDKAYAATIRLGQSTVTDDAEGEVIASVSAAQVTDEDIAAGIAALTGDIQQRPSSVSAIKVAGERSYARVRAGEEVQLAARPVTVSHFEVLSARRHGDLIDIDVAVDVSSGTYIRALARDLGAGLGVGGHLTALRRTRVGDVTLAEALTLERLEEDGALNHLVSLAEAASRTLPVLTIETSAATALGYGQRIPAHGVGPAVAMCEGEAIAIVERNAGLAKPAVVFRTNG
ncbi:tRNA pseudouridine(55) synthase TruB [Demequina sp.]|uniref:tRNA pseudouridine(55) synthase TruB n=1 Tax=Demequina sp. TaxID=2050685 RepID=UPI003D0E88CE